ncbi:helix-turn-helix protein [Dyadobacter jejuensis]|uniref:Helix-turn-helix protein n=1 Tax=Dyadobacter jejuensis TaxID=1082580 RepID=A0A316ANX4_9BACT|nr:helix-turn-helix domain-containing protein [Dyadobacter jejuensis]PWJ59191.1 helix-turn-helix protein [Dyadobacter jejuensis]
MLSLINTILIQAGINVFLLWSNRRRNSEDFYLVVIMGLFLAHTAFKYTLLVLSDDYSVFDKIHGCFSLLYGPYLLFYWRKVIGKPLSRHSLPVHFLPFVATFFLNIFILFDVFILGNRTHIELFHRITLYIVLASSLGYSLYILRERLTFRTTDDIIFGYQLKIVQTILGILFLPSVIFIFWMFFGIPEYLNRFGWYSAIVLMLAIVLNYRFKISNIVKDHQEKKSTDGRKYHSSSLSNSRLEEITHQLLRIMKDKKPYLDADLSLEYFADALSIPKHHVTEALNSSLHVNFYKFINQYRVDECRTLIENMSGSESLIQIGFASGFKSKSTFNKYFKELTGLSPSEYHERTSKIPLN